MRGSTRVRRQQRRAASVRLSANVDGGVTGRAACRWLGHRGGVSGRQAASKALSATAEQRLCGEAVYAGSPASAAGDGRFAMQDR